MRTTTLFQKAAGVFLAFALAVFLVAPAPQARAQSTADLQAQINQLLAMIAQLQAQLGGGSATVCPYTWTRNLGQGSTGADVLALQRFLNASADTRLAVSGAGSPGMETQYYGPITAAAVSKFQVKYRATVLTPLGLVNPTGYFGPSSRAQANTLCLSTTPPTTPPGDDDDDLRGGEGYLDSFDALGDIESVVREGEDDVRVLGIEFDVEEGDVRIERIDVEFDLDGSAGSSRLDRYLDSISLILDGDEVATADADEGSRSGSEHSFRFTGLSEVVREGDTVELYVRVNAASAVDSDEQDEDIVVRIPANGIRTVNARGISETFHSSAFEETFSIAEEVEGDLEIREGDDNPDDNVVEASNDDTTDDVLLVEFEMEADNQDIMIFDLPVRLESTGADVNEIVQSLRLMRGNTTLRSTTISGSGDDRTIVFTNVDDTIDAGDEETYRIVADIRRFGGDFDANDTLMASVTDSLTGWDIEDENGESADINGSAIGGEMTFLESGLSVELVSTDTERTAASQSGQGDNTQYTIRFRVTAGDDDIYIDRSTQLDPSPVSGAGEGIAWATTTESTSGVTNAGTATLTATGSNSGDTATSFRVPSGQSRTFILTVALTATGNGFTAVELTGINYDTDSNTNDSNLYYIYGLDNFRTNPVYMQYNP